MIPESIYFTQSIDNITAEELEGFFVGWENPPSAKKLLLILQNSAHCVIAYDKNSRKVVGFVNCISDGILAAYLPLVEVLPAFQGLGIGKNLIKEMLKLTNEYYMVDLCCDEALAKFYEDEGMTKAMALIKRNYQNQSGRMM